MVGFLLLCPCAADDVADASVRYNWSMDIQFKRCSKCAAMVAIGISAHLCFLREERASEDAGAPPALVVPAGNNYHTPERELSAAIIEPTVARVTSSNTTITPRPGALLFSNGFG